MTTDKSEKRKGWHITFMQPVRVMLQGKSTPLAAVTAYEPATPLSGSEVLSLKCRVIFPVAAGAFTASMTIEVSRHNIAGVVEVEMQ